jgi:hypothetical protein
MDLQPAANRIQQHFQVRRVLFARPALDDAIAEIQRTVRVGNLSAC